MKKILSLAILVSFAACKQNTEPAIELSKEAQAAISDTQKEMVKPSDDQSVDENIKPLELDDLAQLVQTPKDDKVHVFNLFASWCGPCMREIPDFVALMKEDAGQKLDFIFINFNDDPNVWFSDVRDLAIKHGIQKNIRYVDSNNNPGLYAKALSKTWDGGSIPFTLMLFKNKRLEFEGMLSKAELQKAIADIQK